mmetsp:Transcript_35778/g.93853  ORF Transcript_35778/g.93853 Transcript_35778/m.93853 type:complete len:173 (+) Transcript_35778:57-575(+)
MEEHLCVSDCYFFEELERTLGREEGLKWLSKQHLNAPHSKRSASSRIRRNRRNSVCAENWISQCEIFGCVAARDASLLNQPAVCANIEDTQKNRGRTSTLSECPKAKFTRTRSASAPDITALCQQWDQILNMGDSSKIGLMFTDAAHLVLEQARGTQDQSCSRLGMGTQDKL